MEFVRKTIESKRHQSPAGIQIILDQDLNVAEHGLDVERIVKAQGNIRILDTSVMKDKAVIKGELVYSLLYLGEGQGRLLQPMEGHIPFEEVVNLDGLTEGDSVRVHGNVEDLRAQTINSRKISLRSVISLRVKVQSGAQVQVIEDIVGDETVNKCHKTLEYSRLHMNKGDVFRIREDVLLQSNKPNILELIWSAVNIQNLDFKLLDDRISIRGDLNLFVMYMGDGDENPFQFIVSELPFSGYIECRGITEEMLFDIQTELGSKSIEVRADKDGEPRTIAVDVNLSLDINIYTDETLTLLADCYAIKSELNVESQPLTLEKILMKNASKCKVNERIQVPADQPKILQICYVESHVSLDQTNIVSQGLEAQGVVEISVLYIAADDRQPLGVLKTMVPFNHVIEVPGITSKSTFELACEVDQINGTLLDSQEIEIRGILGLEALVFEPVVVDAVKEVTAEPLDYEALENSPSMIGYVVKPGETLWQLAKENHVTIEVLKGVNELTTEILMPGEKLLITKNL